MVHKIVSAFLVAVFVLTGCASGPAASPPTATTQTKPAGGASTPATANTAAPQASPAAKSTTPSGTLTAAISSFADDALDPVYASAGVITTPLFDTVLYIDSKNKGALIPRVAESWTLSADGKSWTFKVRKGVKFHNGDEVTAADLKFSLERLMSAKSRSPWGTVYRNTVDHVDAPDPFTVVVTTKAVDAAFPVSAIGWYVVPKKYIEEKGDDYAAKNPIGTGPWKFVNHVQGQSLELQAVPDHYRITPAFDKLVIKLVPEESTRMAMLQRGDIDIAEISLDSVDQAKAAGIQLQFPAWESQPMIAFKQTWSNTGQPTQDIKVRQALSLAINRDEMSKTFFKGLATPAARFWLASYSWAYDPNWKADPYDPQKAKQLLTEAGYPNKFSDPVINIYAPKQPGAGWLQDLMQIVSGYWEAVGVKTKVTPIDYATVYGMAFAKPVDPKVVGTAYPYVASGQPNGIYHDWTAYASTGFWSLMNDPSWDESFNQVVGERDEAKRIELFRKAMDVGHNQYADLPLVTVKQAYAVGNKVGDWSAGSPGSSLASYYEGIQHK